MNQTDSCAAASGRHCRFSNPQKDHFRSEDCRLHRLHHNHHMNIKVIANNCYLFHFPQMAKSNSITHSFASKAALSAATSLNRVRMRNIFAFKSFASFFSCLSWKEVALGHLHIYTATDPQKLIVNKLPTFC